MKCVVCLAEFEAKRADAKYCSAKCRMANLRTVTDNPVTDNSQYPVTDKLRDEANEVIERMYQDPEGGVNPKKWTLENDIDCESSCPACNGIRAKRLDTPFYHLGVKSSVLS